MKHNHFPKEHTWIVIANAVEAQFYQVNGKLAELIKTLEHPDSRLKSKNLTSDKPGSYQTSHSARGHFVSADVPHLDEQDHFSREINAELETQRLHNSYQTLVLCAEPHFLGLLKKHMNNQVRGLLKKTIEKDYIPLPKHKIDHIIQDIIHEDLI